MSESWVRAPSPPLSRFVEILWYKEAKPTPWQRERLLPMGTVELVIDLSRPDRDPVLCGPHSRPFLLENPGASTVIAAHFKPGGFSPFLPIPAHVLRNEVISLREVWGVDADALRDRLVSAATLAAKCDILEASLLSKALAGCDGRAAVRFALRNLASPKATVAAVAHQIGYSRRHFVDLFSSEVGLTPKAFSRVQRFQAVISAVGVSEVVDWGGLALEAGYYDQAHFANDFRDFSGLTPTEYLALRTSHLNHVPIHE